MKMKRMGNSLKIALTLAYCQIKFGQERQELYFHLDLSYFDLKGRKRRKMNENILFPKWCEVITTLITQVSFGPIIYNNMELLNALNNALPLMKDEIKNRKKEDINIKIAGDVAERVGYMNTNKLKKDDEIRLVFESAFIMLYNFMTKEENKHLMYEDTAKLLEHYPTFHDVSEAEKRLLLTFRNVMKIALMIIPAKNHKNHLIDITARIAEGKNQKYITGSGQTSATARRVLIYETEGDVKPLPRPPRLNGPGSINAKRQNENNDDSDGRVGSSNDEKEVDEQRDIQALKRQVVSTLNYPPAPMPVPIPIPISSGQTVAVREPMKSSVNTTTANATTVAMAMSATIPNPVSNRTISWFGGRDFGSDDPHLIAAEDLLRMRDGTKSPQPSPRHGFEPNLMPSSHSTGHLNTLGSPLSPPTSSLPFFTSQTFPNPTSLQSGIPSTQISPKSNELMAAAAMPSEPNFNHFRNNNNNKSMRQNSSFSVFSLNTDIIDTLFSRNNSIELSFMANGNVSQGHQSELFAKLYESSGVAENKNLK